MATIATRQGIDWRWTRGDIRRLVLAYLLAIVSGMFGCHRLYLRRKTSGLTMLVLGLTMIGLVVTAIWVVVDLFLIPEMIREDARDTSVAIGASWSEV